MSKVHTEEQFEATIEAHLLANGYSALPKEEYDVERAFFPDQVIGFIRETQAAESGRIEIMLGDKIDETLLKDLNFWLNSQGMLPVITAELKNPMTGQTVENAIRQYKKDRDHRELLFEFRKRALVHFAMDTELAYMTTRLAGSATFFLPFNQGDEGGGQATLQIAMGIERRMCGNRSGSGKAC